MNYTIIKPPAVEPVDLTALKQFCRITHNMEDELLTFLARTAREWVEQVTHNLLIEQRILINISFDLRNPKIRLMNGRTGVLIPLGPVQHIHHLHAIMVDGQKILMPRSQYQLTRNGQSSLIVTKPEDGVGMDIDCTGGYGPRADDVPAYLRHTVMDWTLYLYEHRALDGPTLFSKFKEWISAHHPWRLS